MHKVMTRKLMGPIKEKKNHKTQNTSVHIRISQIRGTVMIWATSCENTIMVTVPAQQPVNTNMKLSWVQHQCKLEFHPDWANICKNTNCVLHECLIERRADHTMSISMWAGNPSSGAKTCKATNLCVMTYVMRTNVQWKWRIAYEYIWDPHNEE